MTLGRHHRARGLPKGSPFCRAAAALLLVLALALPAAAADRPFLVADTAAGEPDDDDVWSVDLAWQRQGEVRGLRLAAEYAFDPQTSLQVESSRFERRPSAGIEFKRVFNSFAHDGWGLGLSVGVFADRPSGEGWRGGGWSVALPFSWQATSSLLLHASLGWEREPRESRERQFALAGEWSPGGRWSVFAEAARVGDARLAQVGLRTWLRREKLAFDVAAQRGREDGRRETGWVLGLSWQDL